MVTNVYSGDKAFLMAVVAATLQDLRPQDNFSQDPLPEKGAPTELYQAWLSRHTIPQRGEPEGSFLGDALYDHYTAQAVLGGMPFESRGKPFTLEEALLNLGVNEPESLIDAWKKDFVQAADMGDKLMGALTSNVNIKSLLNEDDEEAELSMPYGVDREAEESAATAAILLQGV
ncbi:hypothetical protein [Acidithiobacillus sulfurivorans]|uniref:Uncharacterized protein n=1 Tax=Acidithiobacillus sulfurivorans TaxID=1958756 RepID=A0ABS6A0F9_9PROT|nr:hypothetical protein [Acidithiobacillus sulfurivorans]MBU2760964.1 hypothetical protein [Acidithiobacillus sulfurivorans]